MRLQDRIEEQLFLYSESFLENTAVIDATKTWITKMVIGLNLCPFARRVFDSDMIRYVVSEATDRNDLRTELSQQLEYLGSKSIAEVETTLLIHPEVLTDFLDYNDFIGAADRMLRKTSLDQTFQLASFHPQYEFADAAADAVENYTNRSPFPMLHILRVESVTRATENSEYANGIPQRNIETLRAVSLTEIRRMFTDEF